MAWMIMMTVIWIVLVGAVVWAVIQLTQDREGKRRDQAPVEAPEEILARRFASGEIDEAVYDSARERLEARRSRC
ncbi:SHOCT domain-containing protein [Nonomuraea helvata]